MTLSVNPINSNIYFRANERPSVEKENTPPSSKDGLTTGQKALVGLGALAGITLGGILVKKRLDIKAAEKIAEKAQKLLKKPKDFSDESLKTLIGEWKDNGKLNLEAGDKVYFMNKHALLDDAGWPGYYKKLHSAMKLSDNGFAIVVIKNGNKKSVVHYYDPQKITSHYILKAISTEKDIVRFTFE